MPAGMRAVFILIREEELSYKEAAARLGLRVATVHTQIARASLLLKECVARYHAGRARRAQTQKETIAMTDDFDLFDNVADPDIALVAAYLARELSIVQIVAVRNRLAADVAFREKVQPVIDGWTFPGSADARAAATAQSRATETTTLSAVEIEAGWRRHLAAPHQSDGPALPARASGPGPLTLTRRPSMTRIAAMIALVVAPVVVSAQLVVYAAHHADAPGHRLALSLVSVSERSTPDQEQVGAARWKGEPAQEHPVPGNGHPLVDDAGHGPLAFVGASPVASVRTAPAVLLPIRGTVTDRNHTPLGNVSITAVTFPSNETRAAISRSDGRWVILIPVGDGRYTVSFRLAGFPDKRIELHAQAGDTLLKADAALDGVGPVLAPDAPRVAVGYAVVTRASRLDPSGRIGTLPQDSAPRPPAITTTIGVMAGTPTQSPGVFAGPVDQNARPASGNRAPDYPPTLRQANIEGEVTVQFVVDTSGKADMSTFLEVKSTQPLFTVAVRTSVAEHAVHAGDGGRTPGETSPSDAVRLHAVPVGASTRPSSHSVTSSTAHVRAAPPCGIVACAPLGGQVVYGIGREGGQRSA